MVLHPNQTYAVSIDNVEKERGQLEDDWDFLPPKKIPDPKAKKPADWEGMKKTTSASGRVLSRSLKFFVKCNPSILRITKMVWIDEEEIDDPKDKKPEGYDDIPATIADKDAKKPDDWWVFFF